ncbi:olfactory receptor 2D3-like [Hemicordylus capensis]|uniref:olfactory receptor 2D3-like n=1 Tax=Hemicordylus capensis TaxID=884348 RepID=UPI002304CEBC|nr:olfactory receptor 2D3-like [Hemicordylus capensis]
MGAENHTSVMQFILVGLSNSWKTQMVLFVVILTIYVRTVVGNLTIILLVRADSRLHTPMYFFLTHLSGLEICYVTTTLPQMMSHLLAGNGTISFTQCMVQMYIALALGCTECVLLGAMAYDRCLAICNPLVYAIAMGRGRQWQLASFSWAGGFLIATINVTCTLSLPFCGSNHINHFLCELPVVLKHTCASTYFAEPIIFVASTLILVGPLSVILTSYGLILHSVLQIRSTARGRKAFSTCASHLAVVTLFYGAGIFTYMGPQSSTNSDRDKHTAVFYIVVTPLLNPIIYTLRNKDVHGAVAKLWPRLGLER